MTHYVHSLYTYLEMHDSSQKQDEFTDNRIQFPLPTSMLRLHLRPFTCPITWSARLYGERDHGLGVGEGAVFHNDKQRRYITTHLARATQLHPSIVKWKCSRPFFCVCGFDTQSPSRFLLRNEFSDFVQKRRDTDYDKQQFNGALAISQDLLRRISDGLRSRLGFLVRGCKTMWTYCSSIRWLSVKAVGTALRDRITSEYWGVGQSQVGSHPNDNNDDDMYRTP